MDRCAFLAQDTVTLALLFMVADQGTDHGERVVGKQHIGRFQDLFFFQQADHLRYVGADRAALSALRVLALEAALRLIQYVYSHILISLFKHTSTIAHLSENEYRMMEICRQRFSG